MFIEPTITWVPSGFSGYIWLDTKIVLKKRQGARMDEDEQGGAKRSKDRGRRMGKEG